MPKDWSLRLMRWIQTTIGEQVQLQRGHDITRAEQRSGAIPVYSSSGLSSFHDTATYSGPGVILGRKGVVGSVWYSPGPYWPHDTTLFVKDFKENFPKFVYYFFKNMAPMLASMDVGSANPTLNRNHVHPIEISWPDKDTQKQIAFILGSLDDKIELNRKMNETLEAMARAIFRSWFVDFDPLRVKARGGDPVAELGISPEIADLFPDSFRDSELGEIPDGWEFRGLDQLGEFLNGLAMQKYPPHPGSESLPVIKIAELRRGVTEATDRASLDVPQSYIISDGDLLFSWSGSLTLTYWTSGKGALNQHLFKVSSEEWPVWLLYHWIEYHLPEFQRVAATKATTMGHINRSHRTQALCAIPPKDIVLSLDTSIRPIHALIVANELEAKELAKTRDFLLPLLLSGKIDISGDGVEARHHDRRNLAHKMAKEASIG